MLPLVVCLSCQFPLGDVAPIFRHIQAKRMKEALKAAKTAPPSAAMNLALTGDNAAVFEALGIKGECCRMHVLTEMDIRDYY